MSCTLCLLPKRVLKVTLKQILHIQKRFYKHKLNESTTNLFLAQQNLKNMKNMKQTSHLSLQVLGCGAPGSPKALYVSTSNLSYLFNCGEGMQRLASEYHYKLTKASNIFITTPVWSNLGGLPGFALTVEKGGQSELHLHGPEGTSDLLEAVRNFATFKTLTIKKPKISLGDNGNFVYTDINMKVEYVSLPRKHIPIEERDIPISALLLNDINFYDYQLNENNKRPSSSICVSKKVRKLEFDVTKGRIASSIAYICKLHPKAGSLNFAKCVEYGVTPGPHLARLKAGEDITLADGTIVKSKDVCSPEIPGPTFIVIECYDEDVLESLITNKSFNRHFCDDVNQKDDIPYCLVHFTPENIMQNSKYKEWMTKFGTNTQHLIINNNNNCLSSEGINALQHQLHILHPTIFPLLADENNEIPKKKLAESVPREDDLIVYRAKNHDTIDLRPLNGFNNRIMEMSVLDEKLNELFQVKGFDQHLSEFKHKLNEKIAALSPIEEYPKLTMLGTGSSVPSKVRNTSGFLLQMTENTSMILDCGEGTVGQMFRLFGKDECHRILSTIKAVYISHLHADHHIGLIGLLQERHKVNKEPAYLLAPEPICGWLKFYNAEFEEITKLYHLVSNKDFYVLKHSIPETIENKLLKVLELKDISTVYVKHCAYAYGVALTLANNTKIVYSGDTMPCDNMILLGKDCDLLIHEATHEDDMASEAIAKRHSTFSQAVNAGHKMKAKFILLTHFSQRYAKMPRMTDCKVDLENVGVAYDNMQIRIAELEVLPLFCSPLRIMFSDFCRELEEKAAKRQRRTNLLQGAEDVK